MANRTQYQVQMRVVKPGADPSISRETYKGTAGDDFDTGALLALDKGGRVSTLATTIDSNLTDPIRFIALEDYDGVSATQYVAVQEIKSDMVFEVQNYASAAATADDIGKRGTLIQDATTGHYAVSIGAANPSVEVVDVEPQLYPAGTYASGNYNKVWVKILPALIETAPADAGS